MTKALVALAVALVACGDRRDPAPTSGSAVTPANATSPSLLRPIARLGGEPALLDGTRSVALRFADRPGWFHVAPGKLFEVDGEAKAIADEIAALGGVIDVHLGSFPIVSGGEHHHEKHVRFAGGRQEIPIEGVLDQVAAFEFLEVWRMEIEARKQLVVVDAKGNATVAAPFERVGPEPKTMSPVSARLCEQGAPIDLATSSHAVVALVLECHPDAPVRVATFRSPGPSVTTTKLGSPPELGFTPAQIATSIANDVALVGTQAGKLAIGRLDNIGTVTVTLGPTVPGVTDAELTDGNVLWTLAGPRVFRELEPVALVAPDGEALEAVTLAFASELGVVVLAKGRDTKWLLAERWPAGAAIVTLPR